MRTLTIVVAGLMTIPFLASCVSVEVGTDSKLQVQYRLDDVGSAKQRRAAPIAHSLIVTPIASGTAGESYSLMFSKEPAQRSAYQYASWTDRPSARFAQLVVERLSAREAFDSVALLGRGVAGDLMLNLSVVDLYHDATSTPGKGTVEVRAELVERASRKLVARRAFAASVTLEGENNAARASVAMTRATGQVLDELIDWVERSAEKLPPARS